MKLKLILACASLAAITLLQSCATQQGNASSVDEHKELAAALIENKLYMAALDEYRAIADDPSVDRATRANINYLIGKTYFERLDNYEQAAAYYVRAKQLDPNGSFMQEANKNLVAALEKSGRMLDAKRQLDEATDIMKPAVKPGDQIVAKIGSVPIWRSEIEEQIQKLPAARQKQFTSTEEKAKFLHNYVGVELLYHAAVRENYGDKPDIREQEEAFRKQIMVDQYLREKVLPNIKIDTADVRNYYAAHKKDQYNNAPFDSVKTQVLMDYQSGKMESAYGEYLQKLTQVEKVEFYEQNL